MKMSGSEENYITKLSLNESSDFIVLQTHWDETGAKIQLLDCSENKEWTGILLMEDIKQWAEDLNMQFETFFTECKNALCVSCNNFLYSIENEKFVWKKNVEFKIIYGEIILSPIDGLKNKMLFDAISMINRLKDNYQKLQCEYQQQNVEFNTFMQYYDDFIKRKDSMETTLLTKFCALLNSKKARISELQTFLKEKSLSLPENESNPLVLSGSTDGDSITLTPEQIASSKIEIPKRKKLGPHAKKEDEISNQPSTSKFLQNSEISNESNSDEDVFDKLL